MKASLGARAWPRWNATSSRRNGVRLSMPSGGDPVLVVHGIFHNCVGGLLSVRDLFSDRRDRPTALHEA